MLLKPVGVTTITFCCSTRRVKSEGEKMSFSCQLIERVIFLEVCVLVFRSMYLPVHETQVSADFLSETSRMQRHLVLSRMIREPAPFPEP